MEVPRVDALGHHGRADSRAAASISPRPCIALQYGIIANALVSLWVSHVHEILNAYISATLTERCGICSPGPTAQNYRVPCLLRRRARCPLAF